MLKKLRPLNEDSEKKVFLEAYNRGKVYNPKFEYADNSFCNQVRVAFFDVFYSEEYAHQAEAILDETVKRFGAASLYKELVWGEPLSPQDALDRAKKYAEHNNFNVSIELSSSLVTTMGKNCLNLVRKTGYYRQVRLESLLDHELSVHFLRSQNHLMLDSIAKESIKQCRKRWISNRLKRSNSRVCSKLRRLLENHVVTMDEEGLATVVTHAVYNQCHLLFQPALCNFVVHLARRNSFFECVKSLMDRHFVADIEDAWTQVMRAKRGMQCTSEPGCFCKDILPFIGAMKLLEKLDKLHLPLLFVAKIRFEEYEDHEDKIREQFGKHMYQLPHFLKHGRDLTYMQVLIEMRDENFAACRGL